MNDGDVSRASEAVVWVGEPDENLKHVPRDPGYPRSGPRFQDATLSLASSRLVR